MERGEIVNKARAQQLRDFSGLQFERGITPTDIDGSVDFGGKLFMFVETKFKGTPLPKGQRLHLENLVKDHQSPAVAYITEHETPIGEVIPMARTIVKERYSNTQIKPRWIYPENDILQLRDTMDRFKKYIEGNK